jgi:hypothetical protein
LNITGSDALNGNAEVPVHLTEVKQGYTARKKWKK